MSSPSTLQLEAALVETLRGLIAVEIKRALADATADDRIPHPKWGPPSRACCEAAAAGELPALKVGKRWLARRVDVEAWLQRRAQSSTATDVTTQISRLAGRASR